MTGAHHYGTLKRKKVGKFTANKLKQWLKTALLFFFVSYPNFF